MSEFDRSENQQKFDQVIMSYCLELAQRALGKTAPNPMVGCAIVQNGQIVGTGFHPGAGHPHAEVFALKEAGEKAKGATVYVSLEPCNHYGRT
ncbi:MAG: bifunctional diaminohydroxyphosphoribosylaminopyrimidine deaminase/5-amino-6-(5-phosphoribosylamino)uracil reductase, partial [Okeania sp. SIO2D1]|nr:bifunctional diaminohydroxyphosphoribosylaminopyrimidine deaminase/5-amino-6-(5-phosphoribosylamino)uracil reductase [Okeania sp. SIO2D1]